MRRVAGCFLGSIATSIVGENLGRRKSVGVGVVIMIVGALLQSTAYTVAHIIVARIVSGVGMGFINSTVPVLQNEFSPKASRGICKAPSPVQEESKRLQWLTHVLDVCAQLSVLNFGIFLSYWIDFGFSSIPDSYAWRVPVILQCIFLLPMLALLPLIPDTPRWYAAHGRSADALDVLERLHRGRMSDDDIQLLHQTIEKTVAYEAALNAGSWRELLRRDDIRSARRLALACFIQAAQQLGGINAIIYYSGTVFQKSIGFAPRDAALLSGYLQTWFFVASFIPWFLIDRIGRRPLLLSMIAVMAAAMAINAALVYQIDYATAIQYSAGIGAAAMLFVFQGAFTIGFQATVWVYPSELLPLRLRQRGSAISTASNWIMNFLIVLVTPPAIQNIQYRTYIIFAVLNAAWLPVIYFFFPETKGLELEEVDRLFAKSGDAQRMLEHGDGVVKADDVHVENSKGEEQ